MGLFKKLISSVLGPTDEDAKEELEEKASSLKKGLGNILNASNAAKEFLKERTSNNETFDSDDDEEDDDEEDDEEEDDEEIPENEHSQEDDEDLPESKYSQEEEDDDIPEDAVLEEDSKFKKCQEIKVPGNIVKIDDAIFSGYSKLERVVLHSGLRIIGEYAFQECENLEYVEVPSMGHLEVIGDHAFQSCTKLKSINMPSHLKRIGHEAFDYCKKLEKLDFSHCTQLKAIGNGAFDGCEKLEKLDFSHCIQLEVIGKEAFDGCERLKEVKLPSHLKKIGNKAFADCVLRNVVIPDSVEEIGTDAFNCDELDSLTLPKHLHTLNTISESSISLSELDMSRCSELKEINCCIGVFEDLEQLLVPNGVEAIRAKDLVICNDIRAVYLPETLKVLELQRTPCNIYCYSPKLDSLTGLSGLKHTIYVKPEYLEAYQQQAATEGVDVEIGKMSDSKLKMY